MPLQGNTFNVALNPNPAKQLLDAETIVPNQIEFRNLLRTDAGFAKTRPGYAQEWSLGVNESIDLLMPFKDTSTGGKGYAVTNTGKIYELLAAQNVQQYTGTALSGSFRPTWAVFDGVPIIVDGQAPVKINTGGVNTFSALGGTPPAGKFIAVIADRVVISGQDDTSYDWSAPGNAEDWSGAGSGNASVTGHGESIQYMTVKDTDLYFFKNASIELVRHIGGNEVFGRVAIASVMDKFSFNRGISGFSVVLAGTQPGPQRFYFYANGNFWMLDGLTPLNISRAYTSEIGDLASVSDLYGFHFAKEHVIRWIEPIAGRTLVFDYVNNVFTEDNRWESGAWQRLPIRAYMESDEKAYIGDYDPTGRVYHWDESLSDDNGTNIRAFRKFRVLLSPNRQKARVNRVAFRFERGLGAIGTSPNMEVRWALDGVDFDTTKALSAGTATLTVADRGNYDPHAEIRNLGRGRELLMEISQTEPVRHLLTHAEVTAKAMGR